MLYEEEKDITFSFREANLLYPSVEITSLDFIPTFNLFFKNHIMIIMLIYFLQLIIVLTPRIYRSFFFESCFSDILTFLSLQQLSTLAVKQLSKLHMCTWSRRVFKWIYLTVTECSDVYASTRYPTLFWGRTEALQSFGL